MMWTVVVQIMNKSDIEIELLAANTYIHTCIHTYLVVTVNKCNTTKQLQILLK